jgi:hypothetical protein
VMVMGALVCLLAAGSVILIKGTTDSTV